MKRAISKRPQQLSLFHVKPNEKILGLHWTPCSWGDHAWCQKWYKGLVVDLHAYLNSGALKLCHCKCHSR